MFSKIKKALLAIFSTILLGGVIFASMLMGYIMTAIGVVLLAIIVTVLIFAGLSVDYKSHKKTKKESPQ